MVQDGGMVESQGKEGEVGEAEAEAMEEEEEGDRVVVGRLSTMVTEPTEEDLLGIGSGEEEGEAGEELLEVRGGEALVG